MSIERNALQPSDAECLDWLEVMANRRGGILLHDGSESGRLGLGLRPGKVGRTLRQAISSAMGFAGFAVVVLTDRNDALEEAEEGAALEGGDEPVAQVETDDRKALRNLYKAYVRLLESGMDRITSLGGDCDPVDVMEAGDPALIAARRTLAAQPRAVPDEVARVAQHIAMSIEFIEKAYPGATVLNCGPIMRNMKRWRDRLLAAAPSPGEPA